MKTNFIKTITLGLLCIFVSSCGKTKLSQLTYIVDDEEDYTEYIYVQKNGKYFKGTAWTEDGKSFMIMSDANGLIQELTVFHPNGQKCATAKLNEKGKIEASGYYDELGNVMNEDHWEDIYEDYAERITHTMLPKDLREALD